MGSLSYVVLEYAASDLQPRSTPFLLLVRNEAFAHSQLMFYLLDGWKYLIPADRQSDRVTIEDSLHEFYQQQFGRAEDIDAFFHQLQRLSRGPLRTGETGSVDSDKAKHALPEILLSPRNLLLCESETFHSILAQLDRSGAAQLVFPIDMDSPSV